MTPSGPGSGVDVEVIDFKTNRIVTTDSPGPASEQLETDGLLPFDVPIGAAEIDALSDQINELGQLYVLQMQCYALAVRLLTPEIEGFTATLHFLDKDREHRIQPSMLELSACETAVDGMMRKMAAAVDLEDFVPRPGDHCRRCSYLSICSAGRSAINEARI